jgi:hypothetical protein
MSGSTLHLDGIAHFRNTIAEYGWQSRNVDGQVTTYERIKDSYFLKAEVLCRVFSCVQACMLIITTTAKQAMRGSLFLVTGIFTCNSKRLFFALKDFLSIIVHCVALPILGIVAMCSPKRAMQLSDWIINRANPDIEERSLVKMDNRHFLEPTLFVAQPINIRANFVSKMLFCALAPVAHLITLIQGLVRAILTFDIGFYSCAAPLMFVASPLETCLTYAYPDDLQYSQTASHAFGFREI